MNPYHFILYIDKKNHGNPVQDHICKTHYLEEPGDHTSRLSFDLDMSTRDNQISAKDKHEIQLVLYKQNKHCISRTHSGTRRTIRVEYLSYYMTQHTSKQLSFPSFMYDAKHDGYGEDGADVFKEECIRQIMHLFEMEHRPSKTGVQFGYKGILYHENVVFAFFDMNQIERFFKRTHEITKPHVWAVVDEIINKCEIFSIKIDERICSLFKEHPVVWDITHDDESLTYPVVMYPLSEATVKSEAKSESESEYEYENETYSTKKNHPSKRDIGLETLELLPYSYSDIFGERYLFTFKPIPTKDVPHFKNGLPAYKRVVCFMYNPQFIFSEKIEEHKQWINKYPNNFVENIDTEDEELIMSYHKIPSICFTQKLAHHHAMRCCGCIYSDLFDEIDPL
jgi:hypothetical protein